MEIHEAILVIEEIVELLERGELVELDPSDRDWLLKASAALGTCQQLGGR